MKSRKCQQCMLESRSAEYILTKKARRQTPRRLNGIWHLQYAPGSHNATWCKVCAERLHYAFEDERELADGWHENRANANP